MNFNQAPHMGNNKVAMTAILDAHDQCDCQVVETGPLSHTSHVMIVRLL